LTPVSCGMGLMSEMTALQSRSPIHVSPTVLVVQIVVAVLLAPVLAGASKLPDARVIVVLAVSLVVLAAGTRALAGADAIAGEIATEESKGVAAVADA